MASLLPMGILLNTTEIYEEIASYGVLPPEKLRQYWNGMTIPSRPVLCQGLGPNT